MKASVCFTMEMLLVVLLLFVSSAGAVYVTRLQGVVHLPMIFDDHCSNDDFCPKPLRTRTGVNLLREVSTMKCNWRDNVPYAFYHRESISCDHAMFREFVGSQNSCVKLENGTYKCAVQPEGHCYAEVRLGFYVNNSNVFARVKYRPYTQQDYNGSVTKQIFSLGHHYPKPVEFELQCTDNTECLLDSVTMVTLQYRCFHQQALS